eukprot:TRINITY_DN45049_c0_g1_i1.p1 TRINITY_DN45049_c0_g1~~TRINITY_DN45049_c0_g1_i1.p1  ORF type:complete len:446 (+),score=67.92 TRINITY_DN45049_c0_g1_i1:115-1452(+)
MCMTIALVGTTVLGACSQSSSADQGSFLLEAATPTLPRWAAATQAAAVQPHWSFYANAAASAVPPGSSGCGDVEAMLQWHHTEALQVVHRLGSRFTEIADETFAKATARQAYPETGSWWGVVASLSASVTTAMTFQAALCAARRGCCSRLFLGEAIVKWRRLQERLELCLWLGTFQGSFALGPDTVEGRYVAGEPWYAAPGLEAESETVSEQLQRQAVAERRNAFGLFEEADALFMAALDGLDAGVDEPAGGSYSSSMASLYEVAQIRTVDVGLLRWLARGLFSGATVAEFGALRGSSAEWLNSSGEVAGAWAFDGIRGISRLTSGRVVELDLSHPVRLPRNFSWALCLEVAEHVPEIGLPAFLGNLRRHVTVGAVVSWSWCGAGGTDHVSCRSPEQAAALFAHAGLEVDAVATAKARTASSVWWIARTVQVYRVTVPSSAVIGQ